MSDPLAITPDTDLNAIRAAIRANAWERSNWVVLADRLDEVGQHELAVAWRWMDAKRRWPIHAFGGWQVELSKGYWRHSPLTVPDEAAYLLGEAVIPKAAHNWLQQFIPPPYATASEALSALATALAMMESP